MQKLLCGTLSLAIIGCAPSKQVAEYRLIQSDETTNGTEIPFQSEAHLTSAQMLDLGVIGGTSYMGVIAPLFESSSITDSSFVLRSGGEDYRPVSVRFSPHREVEIEDPNAKAEQIILVVAGVILVVGIILIAAQGKSIKFKVPGRKVTIRPLKIPRVRIRLPRLDLPRIQPLSFRGNFDFHFSSRGRRCGSEQDHENAVVAGQRAVSSMIEAWRLDEPSGYAFLIFEKPRKVSNIALNFQRDSGIRGEVFSGVSTTP